MISNKTDWPKISIVTPSFNQSRYLEETILSVVSQNYPNLEYIIIDGGSTDNSIDIIKKYENHLAYWISEPDNGMYGAIQKGFEQSTGEIMAWINSDDMYHRNSLFTVAEIFSSFPLINWIVGAITYYDEDGKTVSSGQSRFFSRFDFYNYDYKWIQQESVFWRRSLWEKTGSTLDTSLRLAGDFDLWVRFFQHDKLYVTHALIGGFRFRHKNQKTIDQMEEYIKEIDFILKNNLLTSKDKRLLKEYKMLKKIESVLELLKIFRTGWMIPRFFKKHFSISSEVRFERAQMKFVLMN